MASSPTTESHSVSDYFNSFLSGKRCVWSVTAIYCRKLGITFCGHSLQKRVMQTYSPICLNIYIYPLKIHFLRSIEKCLKMEMFISLSHRLEVRAQVVQAFLAKFQLSHEEMTTLRGARDAPITEVITTEMQSFFPALLCSCFSSKF